jgi:uncharacterized protein (TIGR02646 family)
MISVKKDYDNPPDTLKSENCKEKIRQMTAEQEFSGEYYHNKTVKKALMEIYHRKCAYCESDPTAGAPLQVEHYRPKNGVKEDPSHPGYYWLGHEWTNLLLACPNCNGKGAKSTHFPIEGVRAFDHNSGYRADSPALIAEKPLLLNPESDEPERHFIFLSDGKIRGITERGKETVALCKLNREPLVLARKKLVDKVLNNIREYLDDYHKGECDEKTLRYSLKNLFLDILREAQSPEKPYSRMRWFRYKQFELFFSKLLGAKEWRVIESFFELFTKVEL